MNGQARSRIALVTSNGWGLGHLSRELAIALAIGDLAEVNMFTFSRGLPLVTQFGLRGEFCPGQRSAWIPADRWDSYVERRFAIFLEETQPEVVLFDGVAPYVGVINAIRKRPAISAGWLRRGMWLRGPNDGQLAKSDSFDFVVEPGDIAARADTGPTSELESTRVPPVSLLEVIPPLARDEAANVLGLDPDVPTLLFALATGQPGESANTWLAAIHQALSHSDWQVAVVRSPLAEVETDPLPDGAFVEIAGLYPLSRYLSAFDAAISAAGYNSVHELIPARVPTLFVPKSASKTDNQTARASFLDDQGLALIADDGDLDDVRSKVDALLGAARAHLSTRLAEISDHEMMGGAREVARILTSNPPAGIRTTGGEDWRQPGVKGFVKRTFGPKTAEAAQRVLGRVPAPLAREPVSLRPMEAVAHLLVSEDTGDVARSEHQPVEHILVDGSAEYRTARHSLIGDFYDLVG